MSISANDSMDSSSTQGAGESGVDVGHGVKEVRPIAIASMVLAACVMIIVCMHAVIQS